MCKKMHVLTAYVHVNLHKHFCMYVITFYFLVTRIDYGQMNQLLCQVQKALHWYCKEKVVQFQRDHGVDSREKEN